MIKEIQAREILLREFPDIKIALNKNNENIFKLMQRFTSFTKNCALNGNTPRLRSCFRIAENFLLKGNKTVRKAVEDVYVYSISSLIDVFSPIKEYVGKILPVNLKKDCLKHISEFNAHNDVKDESCLFQEEILNSKDELIEFEHCQTNNKTSCEEDIFAGQYFAIQYPYKMAGKYSNLSRR